MHLRQNVNKNWIYIYQSFQFMIGFIAIIVACNLTQCNFLIILIISGLYFCLQKQEGMAYICLIIFPMLSILRSPYVLQQTKFFAIYSRIGILVLSVVYIITFYSSQRQMRNPLQGILLFLICAIISSILGYYPLISLLKIINFGFFVFGLYVGVYKLKDSPEHLFLARSAFMGFSLFIILGSIMLRLFSPSLAYATNVSQYLREGAIEEATRVITSGNVLLLFSGVTNQPQTLGPILVLLNGWLLCDMLLIEKRIDIFHSMLVLLASVLIMMTRCRTALLSFGIMLIFTMAYILSNIQNTDILFLHVRKVFGLIMIILIVACVWLEVNQKMFSLWLRKTNNSLEDQRSFESALFSSRKDKIDESIEDFRDSPIWGIGFQITRNLRFRSWGNNFFSAPVEKSILPVAILGETGMIGFMIFCLFLIHFWRKCRQWHMAVTLGLFIIFIIINFGEAMFFSPSGLGGIMWCISITGGFIIDTLIRIEGTIVTTSPHS